MTRRSYTREFKAEAVRLVNDQGLSCAEAARDLGLHPSVLYRWVKEYGGDSHQAFPGHGQQGATQAEITSLRREVRKLKAERDILKKSRCLLRERISLRYAFIAKHRGIWPLRWMCEVLDASPSGFYSWLMRPPSQRSRYDEVLVRQIRRSFAESGESYGVRRVWPDMLAWGYGCGRERVARLMQQAKLQARPPRRRLPRDLGERPVKALAPNKLARQFAACRPDER